MVEDSSSLEVAQAQVETDSVKCPCCGASVEVDAETNSVCKFCGATLFDETAVTAQALQPKNTTNTQNENINDNDIVEENRYSAKQ